MASDTYGAILLTTANDVGAMLQKKMATPSETYAPAVWAKTINLLGKLPEATVSGSIVTFPDGADDVPLKSCEVSLSASLDGYSSVEVVQTGKNLFNYESVEAFNAGVIITRNDGDYTIQNNNSYTVGAFRGILFHLKPTTYSLSIGEAISVPIRIYKNGSWFNNGINAGDTSCTFTVSEEADYDFACNVFSNSSLTIKKCQFEVGSTASSYEPYIAPTTHTANLGRTIYGGQADVVKGEGEDGYIKYVIDGENNYAVNVSGTNFNIMPYGLNIDGTISKWLCDPLTANSTNFGYNSSQGFVFIRQAGWSSLSGVTDVATFNAYCQENPITLILPLATPTDFTFSPVEINSKLGDNTMWSDGDMSVTYRRDIDLALQTLSGSRGLMMARPQLEPETEETEPEDKTIETIEETPEDMEK